MSQAFGQCRLATPRSGVEAQRPQEGQYLITRLLYSADGRLGLHPGKTHRARSLPLPHDVGQAMVAYLQGGRPQSACRQVFLRCRPPFHALTNSAVWWIVRQAFERAGIVVPSGIASHLFRHTAASHMVNHGASFKDVADVLGHQSLQTTGIYAKLELNALAAVA